MVDFGGIVLWFVVGALYVDTCLHLPGLASVVLSFLIYCFLVDRGTMSHYL